MGSADVQGDLWGRAAEDWADLQEAQHGPLFTAMLDAAGVGDGVRLLDAGCGGGSASVLAARRGAIVAGLDASRPLIDIARERLPEGDFRVGDLEALPFGNDSFDAVIAANSIQYAEDRVAALAELARVCTPDGAIAVGLFGSADRNDIRVVFAALRDSLPEPPSGDGPFGLSGPGVLEGLIEEAGMKVTGGGEAEVSFLYEDPETFWKGVISGGPPQAAKDMVGEEALREAVFKAVTPHLTDSGGIRLDCVFKYVTSTPEAS